MKHMAFGILLALVFAFGGCANPPTFTWPDRIPEYKVVDTSFPTPYDRWKAERRALKNPRLVAGAAKVDLTPTNVLGTWVAGYMANKRATGVHLPITGRVLVLDDGQTSLVLINLDFIGLMNDRVWAMRRAISQLNARDILIASTHTHAGPDTMGLWGPALMMAVPMGSGVNEAYMERVNRDIAEAVWRAVQDAKPVTLFGSQALVPNTISENAHRAGYKDNELTVLRAQADDGASVATVVNYACHAEFLGQNNSELSADFPGYLYPAIEKREGGVALFFNGAIGGIIVPGLPRRTETVVHLRDNAAKQAADVLASYASEALQAAEKLDVQQIRIRKLSFKVPVENEAFIWLGEKGILTRDMTDKKLTTEIWGIELGRLSILTVPGEIFPSLGFLFKGWMPGEYKMLVGLGNDELGYIMTPDEFEDPLYAYEITVSPGKSAGRLLTTAVQKLYPEACTPNAPKIDAAAAPQDAPGQ